MSGSPIKRLNRALQLDQQRMPLAVNRFAGGHFDPAFADAVFLDVRTFLVVESNTNFMLEHGGDVMRAARVCGQAVGQGRARGTFGHRLLFQGVNRGRFASRHAAAFNW